MLSGLVKNDRFRAFIYLALVLLLVVCYSIYGEAVLLPLILALYFLFYRAFIFWKVADLRN
jgi:high-affinity Fe2+/Pb2+ permease